MDEKPKNKERPKDTLGNRVAAAGCFTWALAAPPLLIVLINMENDAFANSDMGTFCLVAAIAWALYIFFAMLRP
jgi:hypothetical protein